MNTPPLSPEEDIAKNKEIAAVSYTLILAPGLLFGRKESPFIQFHAKQGSVLLLLTILIWLIPFAGRFLELIIVVLALVGFFKAADGKRYELPFVCAILQKDIGSARLKAEWGRVVAEWDHLFGHKSSTPPPASSSQSSQSTPPAEPEKKYKFPHIQGPSV